MTSIPASGNNEIIYPVEEIHDGGSEVQDAPFNCPLLPIGRVESLSRGDRGNCIGIIAACISGLAISILFISFLYSIEEYGCSSSEDGLWNKARFGESFCSAWLGHRIKGGVVAMSIILLGFLMIMGYALGHYASDTIIENYFAHRRIRRVLEV